MTNVEMRTGDADHASSGSAVLQSGEVADLSPKFAEGYARIRDVTDRDGACPAWAKALYMACAAAVRGLDDLMHREIARSHHLGLTLPDARGASLAVMISRGEGVFARFSAAVDAVFGVVVVEDHDGPANAETTSETAGFELDRQSALDYFESYFGFVPDYVELMADEAPRALEGYVLMRQWSLAENMLDAKHVELLLCTINAAELSSRFVNVHANGARAAGATEAEIVESVICAIPISGVAAWLPGADGVMEGRAK